MKKFFCYSTLVFLLMGLMVTTSNADVIRFTATGAAGQTYSGQYFGYVEYDYATFVAAIPGATPWNAVGVSNSLIVGLSFQDPQSPYTSFTTGEVDKQQYGAVFERDISGTPILTEGQGWLVQDVQNGGTVSGINTDGVQLSYRWGGIPGHMDPYDHTYWVNWSTSQVAPVPPTMLLFGPGLVGIAALRRGFKK